jgi:hypothetical protein
MPISTQQAAHGLVPLQDKPIEPVDDQIYRQGADDWARAHWAREAVQCSARGTSLSNGSDISAERLDGPLVSEWLLSA